MEIFKKIILLKFNSSYFSINLKKPKKKIDKGDYLKDLPKKVKHNQYFPSSSKILPNFSHLKSLKTKPLLMREKKIR